MVSRKKIKNKEKKHDIAFCYNTGIHIYVQTNAIAIYRARQLNLIVQKIVNFPRQNACIHTKGYNGDASTQQEA